MGGFGAVREAGKSPEEVGTQESGKTSQWPPPGITPGAAIENEISMVKIMDFFFS